MVLEETCPVVLHVGVIHHDGHEHLGVVLVLLLLVAGGIVLGVERTGVMTLDLIDIDADETGDGAAEDTHGGVDKCADELRIESAGSQGSEGDAALAADSGLKSVSNGLQVGQALDLFGDLGCLLLAELAVVQLVADA